MTIPYGEGTYANGGCDDCWEVPSRHCCLWNELADAAEAAARGDIDSVASGIYDRAKQRAKRRAEAVQALRTKENP